MTDNHQLKNGELKQKWADFKAANPGVRIRNAATALGVSEAELVATECGDTVTRLNTDWRSILKDLEALGEVMALTRNDACVHEKTGVYRNVKVFENRDVGLVLDEQIDLRIFLAHWRYGFAVETPWSGAKDGVRRSLQFFDRDGTAVHKVFVTRQSKLDAYYELVERYRHADQSPALQVESIPESEAEKPDSAIDSERFLNAWSELRDTHDFFSMLKDHGVSRAQALRLAEGRFTECVPSDSARWILTRAAETQTPIMVFVGSAGCIQIHSGPVKTLKQTPPWFNVLDPDFQLHLNESLVDAAWIVQKPTRYGVVTSLELFDSRGEVIALFFGKRKPGIPELDAWRVLLADMPRETAVSMAR